MQAAENTGGRISLTSLRLGTRCLQDAGNAFRLGTRKDAISAQNTAQKGIAQAKYTQSI